MLERVRYDLGMDTELFLTKLFYAGLSVVAFLLSILILKVFRPNMTARVTLVSVSALVLVMAILICGDMFSTEPPNVSAVTVKLVPYLKEAGWFAMGMLFGIGRGDFIVAYLDKRDGIDYDLMRKQAEDDAKKEVEKAQKEKSDPEKSESDKSE